MNSHYKTVWAAGQHMADTFLARVPSLMVAIVVFLIF
jgi:hypothetical protein